MTLQMSPLALALFVALTQGAALAQTPTPSQIAPPGRAAAAAARTKETRHAGGELAAGASAAATDARIVGDKLEAGAAWTRDEVAKAFTVVADAINAVGNRVGSNHKASPFDVGA